MATTPPKGPVRKGAVKARSQLLNTKTGLAAQRDAGAGRILKHETTRGKFKGVRQEK